MSRRELLIVLTPYLVDEEQDLELLNQSEMNRMHWCLSDVNELYGELGSNEGYFVDGTQVFYPDQDPAGENPAAPAPPSAIGGQTPSAHGQTTMPVSGPAASRQPNVMPASSRSMNSAIPPSGDHDSHSGRDTAVPLGTYYGPATGPGNN